MKARDIMTSPVVSVAADATLRDVVKLLLAHRISGVPVVEGGKIVGVIGHGDLLHRHEIGTDARSDHRNWWERLTQGDPGPSSYIKTHGEHVSDVMSREVVAVAEETPVARIATLFESRQVRRIPVLKEERLTGLVTRSDLVRALARSESFAEDRAACNLDDEAIRKLLLAELNAQTWWSNTWSNVFVYQGVVSYVGVVQRTADREAARIAAENIPGVRGVEDRRMHSGDWQPMQ